MEIVLIRKMQYLQQTLMSYRPIDTQTVNGWQIEAERKFVRASADSYFEVLISKRPGRCKTALRKFSDLRAVQKYLNWLLDRHYLSEQAYDWAWEMSLLFEVTE